MGEFRGLGERQPGGEFGAGGYEDEAVVAVGVVEAGSRRGFDAESLLVVMVVKRHTHCCAHAACSSFASA